MKTPQHRYKGPYDRREEPLLRRIRELVRQGETSRDIARQLKVALWEISEIRIAMIEDGEMVPRMHHMRPAPDAGLPDTSGERCACGLRLPCSWCPSIDDYAARRVG